MPSEGSDAALAELPWGCCLPDPQHFGWSREREGTATGSEHLLRTEPCATLWTSIFCKSPGGHCSHPSHLWMWRLTQRELGQLLWRGTARPYRDQDWNPVHCHFPSLVSSCGVSPPRVTPEPVLWTHPCNKCCHPNLKNYTWRKTNHWQMKVTGDDELKGIDVKTHICVNGYTHYVFTYRYIH